MSEALLLLCLLAFGCEQEKLTTSIDETPTVETFVPLAETEAYNNLKTSDLTEAHLAVARNFHETVGAIGTQGEEFVKNAIADSRLNPPLTEEMQNPLAQIDAMVAKGQLPGRESMAARRMIEFLSDLGQREYTMISEMKRAFANWRADASINQTETPLVYHASHMLELVVTTNQVTLPESVKDLSDLEKSNDGQLCSVQHRNWLSARLGLCGAVNDAVVGDIIRISVIAQLRAGAVIALTALGALGGGPAGSVLGGVVGALITAGLGALWSDTWCRLQCDDCGAANGVSAQFNGCTFTGIRATGNPFQFNEGVIFRIDENNDRQTDFEVRSNPGSVTSNSTRLPRNQPFRVQADVICDGSSIIPWGDPNQWIPIDPVRTTPTLNPTVSLTSPPRSGMSYPSGQSLSFSASINTNGWTYLGWSSSGGSPSSGVGRSFSVRYNVTSIVEREINFRFRNPCTGAILTLPGDTFLICNAATTGGFCP